MPVFNLVMKLKTLDANILEKESLLIFFQPETKSQPSLIFEIRFLNSEGSSWRSPSIVIMISPWAHLKASDSAEALP